MELKLKQSWDTITIKDYQAYCLILEDTNIDDFERQIQILALMCSVSKETLYDLPANQIVPLFNRMDFLLNKPDGIDAHEFYDIGGIKYKLSTDITKITAGQFIDLSHHTADSDMLIYNLHQICATLLLPIIPYKGKQFPQTEKYMQTPVEKTADNFYENMPIREAIGISAFFTMVFGLYTEITKLYLEQEMKKQLNKASKILRDSMTSQILKAGSTKNGVGLQQ